MSIDGHFDFETFVIAKLEFRKDFEDGAELQRLAFGKIQLLDLRLRNRRQLLFGDGFFDALRDERLQHFALDILGEAPADQGDGRFAWPKTGHTGDPRELLGHALNFLGYFFRGNFQIQLAAASCFSHGTILSLVDAYGDNRVS